MLAYVIIKSFLSSCNSMTFVCVKRRYYYNHVIVIHLFVNSDSLLTEQSKTFDCTANRFLMKVVFKYLSMHLIKNVGNIFGLNYWVNLSFAFDSTVTVVITLFYVVSQFQSRERSGMTLHAVVSWWRPRCPMLWHAATCCYEKLGKKMEQTHVVRTVFAVYCLQSRAT